MYLGEKYSKKFEEKVINQLIGRKFTKGGELVHDDEWGRNNIKLFTPTIFVDKTHKVIVDAIVKYHDEYERIPYYDTVLDFCAGQVSSETEKMAVEQKLSEIEKLNVDDFEFVRKKAKPFAQSATMIPLLEKALKELKNNTGDTYTETMETLLSKYNLNDTEENFVLVHEDDHTDLEEEKRITIPTGMGEAFDNDLNGGFGKGENFMIFAGSGVGKTTMGVVNGSAAFQAGYNVLHVFLEDRMTAIKTMYRSHWTDISRNMVTNPNNKELVKRQTRETVLNAKAKGGKLILKRFVDGESTMADLKRLMVKLKNLGIVIDLLIIDYLECFVTKKSYNEDWKGQGELFKSVINITDQFNCASLIFTQGSRGAMNTEEADPSKVGGDFKKFQKATVCISIARTTQMQTVNEANIQILKSRVGGLRLYPHIYYDNGNVKIDTTKIANNYIIQMPNVNAVPQSKSLSAKSKPESKKSDKVKKPKELDLPLV